MKQGKSPAQLEREINEALARYPAVAHGVDTIQPRSRADQPLPASSWTPPPHGVDTIRPRRAPETSHTAIKRDPKAYRRLVQKAIERCSRHPRQNHSLFECVFEEVHGGMPFPTKQEHRILEEAVYAARPAASSHAHARKKKIDPHEVKQQLRAAGVDFSSDFHALPRSSVQHLLDAARAAGYRKRKGAPGSTARMYFQYLSRLR